MRRDIYEGLLVVRGVVEADRMMIDVERVGTVGESEGDGEGMVWLRLRNGDRRASRGKYKALRWSNFICFNASRDIC